MTSSHYESTTSRPIASTSLSPLQNPQNSRVIRLLACTLVLTCIFGVPKLPTIWVSASPTPPISANPPDLEVIGIGGNLHNAERRYELYDTTTKPHQWRTLRRRQAARGGRSSLDNKDTLPIVNSTQIGRTGFQSATLLPTEATENQNQPTSTTVTLVEDEKETGTPEKTEAPTAQSTTDQTNQGAKTQSTATTTEEPTGKGTSSVASKTVEPQITDKPLQSVTSTTEVETQEPTAQSTTSGDQISNEESSPSQTTSASIRTKVAVPTVPAPTPGFPFVVSQSVETADAPISTLLIGTSPLPTAGKIHPSFQTGGETH